MCSRECVGLIIHVLHKAHEYRYYGSVDGGLLFSGIGDKRFVLVARKQGKKFSYSIVPRGSVFCSSDHEVLEAGMLVRAKWKTGKYYAEVLACSGK